MNGSEDNSLIAKITAPNTSEAVDSGFMVLPVGEEQFGDFIKSLLGSPQVITNTLDGSFEIDKKAVFNIHQLLLQRINQQNESSFLQLTSRIIFSDSSTVEINNIDDFMSYNEIRSVSSVGLHLEWVFLIKFIDKDVPEKQKIIISFITKSKYKSNIPNMESAPTKYYSPSGYGYINYRIEHTARTWGADIESILNNHLESLMIERSAIKDWVVKKSNFIGLFVFSFFIIGSIISTYFSTSLFIKKYRELVDNNLSFISEKAGDVINQKINYIIDLLLNGAWFQYFYYVLVFLSLALFSSYLFGAWASHSAANYNKSYILLTEKSYKEKAKTLKKYKRKWVSFFFSIIVSIAVGIIANLLFSYYFTNVG